MTRPIPNGCKRNDIVYTPEYLAMKIVNHFKPTGRILEPCKGSGNFLKFMPKAEWCEISNGRDFFDYNKESDWIITNPPYSLFRKFLKHSMELSKNVVFLAPLTHFLLTARLRDMREEDFGIKEIILVEYPKDWGKMGFALSVVHLEKGYNGDIKFDNKIHWSMRT
jgi:hypothetical protein